jgi:hypothetical protein
MNEVCLENMINSDIVITYKPAIMKGMMPWTNWSAAKAIGRYENHPASWTRNGLTLYKPNNRKVTERPITNEALGDLRIRLAIISETRKNAEGAL